LGEIIELEEFSEDPIFGSLNPKLRQHDISIDTSSVSDPGGKEPISELELTSLVCGSSNTVVEFEFEGIKGQEAVTGVYDLTTNEVRGDIAQCVFFIDDQDGEKEYVGERFFDRYPLYFFTGDGSLISKGHAHKTESKEARVPDECFVDESLIDWSECATWNEFGKTKNGDHLKYSKRLDIFGWVKNHIEEHGEDDQIVFCDHTQGEIADYIQIERTSKEITFYHCKARNENKDSGARLDDIREVVGQVLRSITWVRDSGLPGQIDHRDENTQYPHFVSNGSSFSDFKSNFSPMAWDFTVAIVQPGLNYEDAKSKNNINTLLLTCKEWLEGIDASFEIYGDPNNQIKSMSRIKRIQSPLLYDVL